MSHNPPPPETCQRTGLVMTCFEDGKKRFRAAKIAQELPTDAPNTAASVASAADPSSTARAHD